MTDMDVQAVLEAIDRMNEAEIAVVQKYVNQKAEKVSAPVIDKAMWDEWQREAEINRQRYAKMTPEEKFEAFKLAIAEFREGMSEAQLQEFTEAANEDYIEPVDLTAFEDNALYEEDKP